jgi:hypothetical protein
MPIASFTTRGAKIPTRELGPAAEDFHAAFGPGRDEQRIARATPLASPWPQQRASI